MTKKTKKCLGIIMSISFLLMFMMPIFYVKDIEVTNNQYYSKEELLSTAGIQEGHLLDFSFGRVEEALEQLDYIAQAVVSYQFPGRVVIDLVEKAPFAYVEFKGTYLCLNEQGQVIEQRQTRSHELPVIEGLKFNAFKNGEVLPVLNEDNWLVAIQVIKALDKYNYVEKVNKVDIHNIEEIHLYVDKLDVIMGDIGDFDKKIEVLIQIHDINGFSMGVLTITPNLGNNGEKYLATLKPVT